MRILIAIPVHNEIKYVQGVLAKVRQFASDILMIDDGSTDGTSDLLRQMAQQRQIQLLSHPVNRGYGASVIDAFTYADQHGYDWVITMDCDEQHEPEMIPQFVQAMKSDRWDLISGSRYMENRADNDLPPTDRRAINVEITSLLNDLFGWDLTDAFCGYKAHRVAAMMQLDLTETGYAFPLQFWPQVHAANLRLTEIPVRLIYNDPNRHFGGMLDDAFNRMQHYLSVLEAEIERVGTARQACQVKRKAREISRARGEATPLPPTPHHATKEGHAEAESPVRRACAAHQPCGCSESDR